MKVDPGSRRIVSSDESGHLLIWSGSKARPETDEFDSREMPDNVVSMGSAAGSFKVAGFVVRPTGLEVAMQKGTIEELDFFERLR